MRLLNITGLILVFRNNRLILVLYFLFLSFLSGLCHCIYTLYECLYTFKLLFWNCLTSDHGGILWSDVTWVVFFLSFFCWCVTSRRLLGTVCDHFAQFNLRLMFLNRVEICILNFGPQTASESIEEPCEHFSENKNWTSEAADRQYLPQVPADNIVLLNVNLFHSLRARWCFHVPFSSYCVMTD